MDTRGIGSGGGQAAVRGRPPADDGGRTPSAAGALLFADVVRPIVDEATRRLAATSAALPAGWSDALADALAGHLTRRLTALAAKTLVLELNTARVRGTLAGRTPGERFAHFVEATASAVGRQTLFAAYPALATALDQAADQAVRACVELAERFGRDPRAIVAALLGGVDPGPVVEVDLGRGDRHQDGRSVAVLRFADGRRVVYKPRPVEQHLHLARFAAWLNAAVPALGLRTVRCVAGPDHGWTEFVGPQPCATEADLERFYRRLGALLALLHVLDATDVHCDNLIAQGDQPLLVDAETLFHPSLAPALATGPDPSVAALGSSVARTALLPTMVFGEHGAVDISGMGGGGPATAAVDGTWWADAGTDRMRLVRGPVRSAQAHNRPMLAGRPGDPRAHLQVLLAGFRAAYDAISARRDEWTAPDGLLSRCEQAPTRVVARHTQTYAALLDAAGHPDVLRDPHERERLLAALPPEATGEQLSVLAPYETADLLRGDIPLFTGRAGSRDVWTSTGVRLPDLLAESGLGSVRSKLLAMGPRDRWLQEWTVAATLACRSAAGPHAAGSHLVRQRTPVAPDRAELLDIAGRIADDIAARACQDGERVNWLGVEPLDGEHWALLPMGAGLADGYTGVALFLAQLAALTGLERHRELARRALLPLPRLLAALAGDELHLRAVGPGAFLGMGGIAYATARLAVLLDDAELASCAEQAVELTARADDGREHGLAEGTAGALVAMLAVSAETGSAAAERHARRFADALVDAVTEAAAGRPRRGPAGGGTPAPGLWAGHAGVGWALDRYARTGGSHYAAAARLAVGLDPSAVAAAPPEGLPQAWCNGRAGLLLAAAGDKEATRDGALAPAARRLAAGPALSDSSLCHGELGVLEALHTLAPEDHGTLARVSALLSNLRRVGPRCGTPEGVPTPGLITGLAGVGYGVLRLGFASTVPSVLLMGVGGTAGGGAAESRPASSDTQHQGRT